MVTENLLSEIWSSMAIGIINLVTSAKESKNNQDLYTLAVMAANYNTLCPNGMEIDLPLLLTMVKSKV